MVSARIWVPFLPPRAGFTLPPPLPPLTGASCAAAQRRGPFSFIDVAARGRRPRGAIEKLASKPPLEAMSTKQADNPQFAFLNGGEGSGLLQMLKAQAPPPPPPPPVYGSGGGAPYKRLRRRCSRCHRRAPPGPPPPRTGRLRRDGGGDCGLGGLSDVVVGTAAAAATAVEVATVAAADTAADTAAASVWVSPQRRYSVQSARMRWTGSWPSARATAGSGIRASEGTDRDGCPCRRREGLERRWWQRRRRWVWRWRVWWRRPATTTSAIPWTTGRSTSTR